MGPTPNPLSVIKLASPGTHLAGGVIKRSELEALDSATGIIQAAENKAQEIIENAQSRAEVLCANARLDAQQKIWDEATGLLADLRLAREQASDQAIEVAQTILQKAWDILCGSLSDTERLDCALEQAARYFVSTSAMKLRVNPHVLDQANTWLDERRSTHPGLELLTVEPDISMRSDEVRLYLDRGGVIRAEFSGALEILKAQWI